MIIGSLIVAACLIVLGWTKEIVGTFIGDPDMVKTCSIAVAVLSIYALDFAVNAGELRNEKVYFQVLISCSSPILLPKLDC